MTASRSDGWQTIRDLEDIQALLAVIEDRRHTIAVHAWREGNWRRVFVETQAMKPELAAIKHRLSILWVQLHTDATGAAGRPPQNR